MAALMRHGELDACAERFLVLLYRDCNLYVYAQKFMRPGLFFLMAVR